MGLICFCEQRARAPLLARCTPVQARSPDASSNVGSESVARLGKLPTTRGKIEKVSRAYVRSPRSSRCPEVHQVPPQFLHGRLPTGQAANRETAKCRCGSDILVRRFFDFGSEFCFGFDCDFASYQGTSSDVPPRVDRRKVASAAVGLSCRGSGGATVP